MRIKTLMFAMLLAASGAAAQDSETDGADEANESASDQSVKPQEPAMSAEEKAQAARHEAWLADSQTIYALISAARNYRESANDSSVQEKRKKKLLASALETINAKAAGKPIKLKRVEVSEVDPEKELTKTGIKKLKLLRKELEKDPTARAYLGAMGDDWAENPFIRMAFGFHLAGCRSCFRETGRYIAKFKISNPDNNYDSGIKVPQETDSSAESENEIPSERLIEVEIQKILTNEAEALKLNKGTTMPISGEILGVEYNGRSLTEKVTIYIR